MRKRAFDKPLAKGVFALSLSSQIRASGKKVDCVYDLNSTSIRHKHVVKRKDISRIVIRNCSECRSLLLEFLSRGDGDGNLDISYDSVSSLDYKIDFLVRDLSCRHFVSAAQQLKIDRVLQKLLDLDVGIAQDVAFESEIREMSGKRCCRPCI